MHEQYPNQLPVKPVYRTADGEFQTLQSAARSLSAVTLRRDYELIRSPWSSAQAPRHSIYEGHAESMRDGSFSRPSLFNEISVGVKRSRAGVYYEQAPGDVPAGPAELAKVLLPIIRERLEEDWIPGGKHVVMYSSGYDTRVVTEVLRRLWKTNGDEWLGDVRFCCFSPEREDARRVFEYQGWPEETWWPVSPGRGWPDYHACSLDFEAIGASLGDAQRVMMGPLHTQLSLGDWLDDCPQGLSALYSDELGHWSWHKLGDVAWFLRCYGLDCADVLPGAPHCAFLMPFASIKWLEVLLHYKMTHVTDELKRAMLHQLAEESPKDSWRLPSLPNWRFGVKAIREKNGGWIDEQGITPTVGGRMDAGYSGSWYARVAEGWGRSGWVRPPPDLRYRADDHIEYSDEKHKHYITAAICEHVRQFCEVK